MANSKLTALTAITSFSGDEVFYVVDDDDGTPVSRKITVEDLATGLGGLIGVYADYTPTVAQNGTKTTSSAGGRYCQIGKFVHCAGSVTLSQAGTSGQPVTVSLPVNSATTNINQVGTGGIQRISGGLLYRALVVALSSNNALRFFRDAVTDGNEMGINPAFALASGDIIHWSVTYEAA